MQHFFILTLCYVLGHKIRSAARVPDSSAAHLWHLISAKSLPTAGFGQRRVLFITVSTSYHHRASPGAPSPPFQVGLELNKGDWDGGRLKRKLAVKCVCWLCSQQQAGVCSCSDAAGSRLKDSCFPGCSPLS